MRSRGKGERGTKSGSARGSAATVRKRRKGRGKRSGKEIETANGSGIVNGRGRRSARGSARGREVETSAKVAADRERELEKIKNETVKKMRKTCTNGGDLRGGLETKKLLTKNG